MRCGVFDRGSFGVVHRAIERATGRNWVAKFVACTTIERAMVRGEIDIRNNLRHPNLLQLHEAFETHGEMAFILELYEQLLTFNILLRCVAATVEAMVAEILLLHGLNARCIIIMTATCCNSRLQQIFFAVFTVYGHTIYFKGLGD